MKNAQKSVYFDIKIYCSVSAWVKIFGPCISCVLYNWKRIVLGFFYEEESRPETSFVLILWPMIEPYPQIDEKSCNFTTLSTKRVKCSINKFAVNGSTVTCVLGFGLSLRTEMTAGQNNKKWSRSIWMKVNKFPVLSKWNKLVPAENRNVATRPTHEKVGETNHNYPHGMERVMHKETEWTTHFWCGLQVNVENWQIILLALPFFCEHMWLWNVELHLYTVVLQDGSNWLWMAPRTRTSERWVGQGRIEKMWNEQTHNCILLETNLWHVDKK